MTEQEHYFVEIQDRVALRRKILETLRDVIETLQCFERFKDIRKEKIVKIGELKAKLIEINHHFSQFKDKLPEVKLPKHKHKAGKKKKSKAHKEHVVVARKSELDVLEDELKAIESKIQTLS